MTADAPLFTAPAPSSGPALIEPIVAAMDYQMWGWPITLRRDQVNLDLDNIHAVALIIQTDLATTVARILTTRRCPIPVLTHPHSAPHAAPHAAQHQVLLAGKCCGMALPWPPEVQRAVGSVLLPPTRTAHGPLHWQHPPRPNSLRLCREIDILAAIHAAQRNRH